MPPEEEAELNERLLRGLNLDPAAPPAPLMYSDGVKSALATMQTAIGLTNTAGGSTASINVPPVPRLNEQRRIECARMLDRWLRHDLLRAHNNGMPVKREHILSLKEFEYSELLFWAHKHDEWSRFGRQQGLPEPAHRYVYVLHVPIPANEKETEETMLEQLLKLYTMYMATGVTSPMPHFVGPPGSGKSTVFRTLAEMLGVRLHIMNVSRLSPLELEGVQMPDKENTILTLLHNPMWKQLKDGDIVLLDEFLRGFPEVYNGLLDILTSREVAGLVLPKVFIAGASNSTVAYDKALEDRLLHIKVPDPRINRSGEKGRLAWMIIDQLGLNPAVKASTEMDDLFATEVLPMFEILDSFDGNGQKVSAGQVTLKGTSVRKLIGMAELRHVTSRSMKALIEQNNTISNVPGKQHFVFLLSGEKVPAGYKSAALALADSLDQLTPVQRRNRELNLQLISMQEEKAKGHTNREDDTDDDPF